MMLLSELQPGERARIGVIQSEETRIQTLRFGIGYGAEILVEQVVPLGPLIVRRGHQLLALDRGLAASIEVKRL